MIDCKADAVAVKWRPVLKGAQKVDPTKAHLGTCSPSSSDENVLLFFVSFHDCDFRIQVCWPYTKISVLKSLPVGLCSNLLFKHSFPALMELPQSKRDL